VTRCPLPEQRECSSAARCAGSMPRRGTRHVPQSGHATTGRSPGYSISRLGIVVLASNADLPLSRMQSPIV
jgi:hypothetical protein